MLQVVESVKEVHMLGAEESNGRHILVHNDIKPMQFIQTSKDGSVYKLNDFNKSVFLTYKKGSGNKCPFHNKITKSTSRVSQCKLILFRNKLSLVFILYFSLLNH